MAGQVLRCCTDRHTRLIDFETNLAPLSKRVQVDPSLDESLGQILPLGLECVGTNIHRSLRLIGFYELIAVIRTEKLEKHVDQFSIIAIGVHDVCS